MKKQILIALLAIVAGTSTYATAQSKPTREVKMPEETGLGITDSRYFDRTDGFFISSEASAAYSLNRKNRDIGYGELDVTAGYRLSEYFRAGIGLGARMYFHDNVRDMDHSWGLPLFVNARGNFIPTEYYTVIPFWSMDIGTTFPDGFMIRPSVGIRIGQQRSAFLVSVAYVGQQIREFAPNGVGTEHNFKSFISLKLGYEF